MITTYDEPVDLVRLSVRDAKRLTYPHPFDAARATSSTTAAAPRCGGMARGGGRRVPHPRDERGLQGGQPPQRARAHRRRPRRHLRRRHAAAPAPPRGDARLLPRPARRMGADAAVVLRRHPGDAAPGVARAQRPARARRDAPWAARSRRRSGRSPSARTRSATDPRAFYDVVQRCRNWCNAAFCCGAGSIHRREAVMEARRERVRRAQVAAAVRPITARRTGPGAAGDARARARGRGRAARIELTPFEFHVSEDIYTSIRLHADPARRWRSVYHPRVLTRMLSPQDLARLEHPALQVRERHARHRAARQPAPAAAGSPPGRR